MLNHCQPFSDPQDAEGEGPGWGNINQAYEGEELQEPCEVFKRQIDATTAKKNHIALSLGSPGKDRRRGRLPIEVWSRDLLLQTLSTLSHSVAI